MALSIVLFLSSFMLLAFGFVGFEFISQADRGESTVTIELPPGAKVETTNYSTLQIEKILRDIPEVKKTFVNVGVSSEGLLGQTSNNSAEINVILTPKGKQSTLNR